MNKAVSELPPNRSQTSLVNSELTDRVVGLWWWLQVKRLLDILRHDDCDDSVICDCSLPVVSHRSVDDDTADLSVAPSCDANEPQPSPLRPQGHDHVLNGEQQASPSASDRTPPKSSSSSVHREYDLMCGRCQTFKLPDVQVRLASPQQSGPSDRPSASAVVSSPDVVSEPHYTVV